MKSAITISLVPEARGGPFVFWDDAAAGCKAARELGYDAVELFAPSPEALSAAFRSVGEGLRVAAIGTGAGWVKHKLTLTNPDPDIRKRAIDFVRSMIEAAGNSGFHAPAIIGSMQGRWGEGVSKEQALEWLGEGLELLALASARYSVPLIYEPLNRYETNLCNTVAQGTEFLNSLGSSNIVLLADLFHMNIEEEDIAAAIRAGEKYIGHVHFVDSNRRPAGCGHLDYAPIIAALNDIDYHGFLSAECLPWPDSQTAAKQTIKMFDTLVAA
jgi:sugar phosphate isomerase/epimerase